MEYYVFDVIRQFSKRSTRVTELPQSALSHRPPAHSPTGFVPRTQRIFPTNKIQSEKGRETGIKAKKKKRRKERLFL